MYEIGWHSSDTGVCHVAAVNDDVRDDLFDVQLYGDNENDSDRRESLEALEQLVERANANVNRETVKRVLIQAGYESYHNLDIMTDNIHREIKELDNA
jgi:hypothetical protein